MEEIEVVYKDGVFKPLKQIKLKEDALREFLEERR